MIDDMIEVILEVGAEVFFATASKKLSVKHRVIVVCAMTVAILALCFGIYQMVKGDATLGIILTAGGVVAMVLTVWRCRKLIHRADDGDMRD